MKNFIIICCLLAAVFGQIRSVAIEHSSCSSIQLDKVTVNVSEIFGNYFGCVDSPNKLPESKDCIRLNLVPTSSNSWDSRLFLVSKNGNGESLTADATIKDQEIELAYNISTMPPVTFTTLDTKSDYLIYLGCKDKIEDGWIAYFAKTLELCEKYRPKLDEIIQKYNLTSIPLVNVNHDNCGSYKV
ncbi:GSCOCG00000753001-RA-CDS [Cotesia congregata]|uniref:Uncharacterized protein n=1 Tax=Cotesia congregata TaxID=51543 RepID=A0A8J2HKS8_COTCN|nr:GSCOCG00000753001-RA-CDS [Cotesia congregata]CAG5095427.1 Protein of unknown function [Cotesia congregata]